MKQDVALDLALLGISVEDLRVIAGEVNGSERPGAQLLSSVASRALDHAAALGGDAEAVGWLAWTAVAVQADPDFWVRAFCSETESLWLYSDRLWAKHTPRNRSAPEGYPPLAEALTLVRQGQGPPRSSAPPRTPRFHKKAESLP